MCRSPSKSPAGLTEGQVPAPAPKVVSQLLATDYQRSAGCSRADLSAQLGAAALQRVLGSLKPCRSTAISGVHGDHTGDHAMAALVWWHANSRAAHIINSDNGGDICGLYLK